MADKVYKSIELYGTSDRSVEEAVKHAVARASKTVRNMGWMEVTETRGRIEDGKVVEWQVGVKIGFALDDDA